MWNATYEDFVEHLVQTNYKEYPYYVAHTCTYWNVSNSGALPAFKVYFSKEPITASDLYVYNLPADTICYSVIGGNGSSNYNSQRVTTSTAKGRLNIDWYEFVYTNAETTSATVQPDILATNEVTQSHFDGVGLVILAVLLSSIIYRFVKP